MCRVYLSRSDFFITQFVIAAEAKLNHSHQLTLLFERQVAVLENLTFTERNPHECLILLREEEIVADVLEFEIGCCTCPDKLIN